MSLVVTANTTFLSGLSCAWLAASHRPSTMPRMATAVTMRFIECPLFRGRRPGWCSRANGLVGLRPEDHVPLHRLHDEVEDHPHHGEQDEHGEDAGDVEGEVELQDQVAEPFLRAHELAHDGAEHAEHDGDVEPREHEGQRVGKGDEAEGLPAGRSQRPHQVELGRIHRFEAHDHVDEHGEESHHPRDDDLGGDAEAEPYDYEGRDGDLGQGLERYQIGVEGALHEAELRDDRPEHDARHCRDDEAHERLEEGNPEVGQVEPRPHAAHEGARHRAGRGHEEVRYVPGAHHPFPEGDEEHEHERNEHDLGTIAHVEGGVLAHLRPDGALPCLPPDHFSTRLIARGSASARRATLSPCGGEGIEGAQSSHPRASKRWRIRRVYTPNSSEAIMSRSRGRGSRTSTISLMRPGRADITMTRSARKAASGMEWVMNTMVFPDSFQMRRSSRFMNSRVMASSAPKGSSMRRSDGSCTRARAMATRCRMPPESSCEYLSSNPVRPTSPSSTMARPRERARSRPSTSTGSITLSKTVRHGSSTGSWNTMPMSWLGSSTECPRRVTRPAERGSSPARILSSVVFPQPDCPTMVMNSPAAISTEMPARACTWVRPRVAYVFSRLDTTIRGALTGGATSMTTLVQSRGLQDNLGGA